MKKIISIFCLIIVFAVMLCLTVNAEESTSFTHIDVAGDTKTTVLSREMYTATSYITASALGLEKSLTGLSDICYGENGEVYILCESKLLVLNSDYTFNKECVITDSDGNNVDFTGAAGVFVDNNSIYIADTNNGRVIIATLGGEVKEIWNKPESDLIPSDFVFQPTSVVRDNQDNTYVISQGCYYGALTYSPEGEFKGFYGANTVDSTALDTLEFLWDKLTGSDAKRAATIKKLPYSFVDFSLDKDGYMVVCTGTTESTTNGKGQIRKISPGGSDILYGSDKTGDTLLSSAINFLETKVITKGTKTITQNIIALDVDKNGYIYALDQTYGLIYVYDDGCNLLGAFGGGFGTGNKLGLFEVAESIAVNDDTVLVADSSTASITVFSITDYGKLLKTAQTLYLQGQYNEAEDYWNEILTLDRGNQMAYRGLAMVKYYEEDYSSALDYAEKGLDYSVYDLAYQAKLKNNLKNNFAIISAITVLVLGGLIALFVVIKKRKIKLIKNPLLETATGVVFHPFRSFNDVKYKKLGSVGIAVALLALFFVTATFNDTASGFLYSTYSPKSYNIFYTMAKTVILVVLWSIANWLVAALCEGKGTFKEVFIVSSYSLIPLIVYNIVRLILSYMLPLSGMGFISGLYTVILIYTFFILSVAMMSVHEYSFFKFLSTGLLTLFGMLLVVFILFMIIIQIQQFGIFISSIFMEVVYR